MRAMKRQPTATSEASELKRPSRLADAELTHLESVIRHILSANAPAVPLYLDRSYWLRRLERLEKETRLVPAQMKRLGALRNLLIAEASCRRECA
jgi:hypothetical protein